MGERIKCNSLIVAKFDYRWETHFSAKKGGGGLNTRHKRGGHTIRILIMARFLLADDNTTYYIKD